MDLAPLEVDGRSWYVNPVALSTINSLIVELSIGPHGWNDRLSSYITALPARCIARASYT